MPPAVASYSTKEAMRMLELFASIGATHFDLTHIDLCGQKRGYRRNRSITEVTRSMPCLLESAERRQNNLIVRPRVAAVACIQLDDLDREKAKRIAPAAFLILKTSPGNYQTWVAVKEAPTGTSSRLRRGIGADLNASGATRVAGSRNFKPKYEPGFPTVRIAHAQPGRIVSVADLEALNVLAKEVRPVEMVRPTSAARSRAHAPKQWPDYRRVLARAPVGPSGNPRRTSVDFTWCKIATSWGHTVEATAARLMEESTKAQENGPKYAWKTAERAAWAAQHREPRQSDNLKEQRS